jgi:transcriptional regulator with XRE-family HTH domain
MGLGCRLREARDAKGWSQVYVAKLVGITSQALSNYERGERDPDTPLLNTLADLYDVSTDYLLCRTDDPRPLKNIQDDAHQRIEDALAGDPEADDLLIFWKELKEREDLFLLFKQVRPLSDDSIRRVIRVIKAIEDEEAKEFGDGL